MPLIDWSKPIETTDGGPARVICTDRQSYNPVVVLLTDRMIPKEESILAFPKYFDTNSTLFGIGLRNKAEEEYFVINPNTGYFLGARLKSKKEVCDQFKIPPGKSVQLLKVVKQDDDKWRAVEIIDYVTGTEED